MTAEMRYPGPRPLDVDQRDLLVGREDDIARLRYAVLTRQLVHVTAPSGTGKSSLLRAGLVPRLSDHKVVMLSGWGSVRTISRGRDQDEGPLGQLNFLYAALRQAFHDSHEDPDLGEPWPEQAAHGLALLKRRYATPNAGEPPCFLVVILDQVEELMRLAPDSASHLLAGVGWAARQLPFKIILSLRTEYKEELAPLESTLPPRLWQAIRINELAREEEKRVITRPLEVMSSSYPEPWSLEPETAQVIARFWESAHEGAPAVGLLHLQAIMWVIEYEAAPAPGEVMSATSLAERSPFFRSLLAEAPETTVGNALTEYLEYSLGELSDAEDDPRVAAETRHTVARFVDDLSAAGYKAYKRSDHLFTAAFEEIERMRWKEAAVNACRKVWSEHGIDLTTASSADLYRTALSAGVEAKMFGGDRSLLAGRVDGLDQLAAFCEMTAVFERGLGWLVRSGVVRITKQGDSPASKLADSRTVRADDRLVSIIHDGYGEALNRWAESVRSDASYYLLALTGESGNAVLTGTDVHNEVVEGVRWPGCSVENATFRDVTFNDCDLRGALFYECAFDNVRFERCYAPGLLFIGPQIAAGGLVVAESVTRTLTVTGGAAVNPGTGLVFEGIDERVILGIPALTREGRTPGVDGLFVDDFTGPWTVRSSRFRHLLVSGVPHSCSAGPGSITDSEITLIRLDGQVAPVISFGDSRLRLVDPATRNDRVMTEAGGDY